MNDLTTSDIVQEVLNGPAMLFHDQYNSAYISPSGNGREVMRVNSGDFKNWLSGKIFKEHSKVMSTVTLNNVVQTLTGAALHEKRQKDLDVRISFNGKSLWYDLGHDVVEIKEDGWAVLEKPPVKFRRFNHQKSQDYPVAGGSITDLAHFVNISNNDELLLFLVFTVLAFLPGFPHPLLILHGPQGAGKSTPMRVLKELIDPSGIQGVATPKEVGAFAQFAFHHAFIVFDNLSAMPTWFSDALARASTGDGFSKRALYTDDDDIVYRIQRTIAINGINQVITKADLLDRSILIGLKRIEPDQRISEHEFWKMFNEEKAGILGAIFTVLGDAISKIDLVELNELPRMADFAKWGYAVAEAIGYKGEDFISAYKRNIEKQNEEAIEASPVAQALIKFMKDYDEWESTAAALLQQLNRVATFDDLKSSMLWPKDPQWLSKRLNEIEPNLQTVGIFFERYVQDQQRVIKIVNKTVNDKNGNNTVSTSVTTK